MLKPLIFNQNKLEHHCTLNFWGNPWSYVYMYIPGEDSWLSELLQYRPAVGASQACQTAPGTGPAARCRSWPGGLCRSVRPSPHHTDHHTGPASLLPLLAAVPSGAPVWKNGQRNLPFFLPHSGSCQPTAWMRELCVCFCPAALHRAARMAPPRMLLVPRPIWQWIKSLLP